MKSKLIGINLLMLALLVMVPAVQGAEATKPIYKASRQPIPYFTWTGFYLGANAGFGLTDHNNAGGFVWGGTIGYNQQIGTLVLGLEGDYDWSNIRATSTIGVCATSATGCVTTNNWIATVRGRAGFTFDRYLAYFTGGLAYGNVKIGGDFGSDVANRSGYAIGGGLEYAIGNHWTAKVEYLYVDMSDHSCTIYCSVPLAGDFRQSFVRMGVNYKFYGPTSYISSRD